MKRNKISEDGNSVIVGKTRIDFAQMDTTGKVLAWVYSMIGSEKDADIRNFIEYCDNNGFAIVNWACTREDARTSS